MDAEKNEALKRKAVNGVLWKLAERGCAQVVSLVVSIVLARLLMPEDYAVVSIVTIFFTFCNVLISGGLNTALIQKKDADAEDYSAVLMMSMTIAGILYGLMFFLAPTIARLYEKNQLVSVIRVMGLTFFINAVKSVLSAYTSNHLQFRKFFFSTIIGTVISAVVGIGMALHGMGAWALVAQQMTNSFIDTLVLFFTTRIHFVRVKNIKRIKPLFDYGWKVFVSSIVTVAYDQINPLIVGLKFTDADLAFYSKGKSFPGLINSTISDTLAAVLFPVMSKVQDNTREVLALTRRYVRTASYVIFPMMVGFAMVAESFVQVVLTEKWMDAAPYIQIFALAYMFDMINVGNLQAIKAIGRSDISLILEIMKKSAYFVIVALFVFLTDSPEALALSSILCTCVALLINTFPNRKLIGYRYRFQLMDVLPNLALSLVMGVVVYLVGNLALPGVAVLALQVLAGMAVYVAMSLLTKNESFFYLLQYIKRFTKRG